MAYVVDRNLYYQNGSTPPLQLTNGGKDWRPLSFSDNGKKVFFTRGIYEQEIYSINVDGSDEEALVTNSLLLTFGKGYDESTTACESVLAHHTQFLLFSTCSHSDPGQPTPIYNSDLFIVDTKTNKVKRLLPQGQGGQFYVSPDGTMLAIDRQNAIDILGIDGKLIHRKIATYPHSEPYGLSSKIYWIADSSELILALPINKSYDTSVPPTYAIWHYSPASNTSVQVNLDPPLMSNEENWVSPDGQWITYINFNDGLFLGNLRDGSTQPYPNPSLPDKWSLDSVHFVYTASQPGGSGLYLGNVDAPSIFVGEGELAGWLDSSKYLYYKYSDKTFLLGEIGKEPMPILVGITPLQIHSYPGSFIFTYQNR